MSKGRVPVCLWSCVACVAAFFTLACSSVRDPRGPASFLHALAYYHDSVSTRMRVEGQDHGGLGLRSRGEGIGHGMEALLKKKKKNEEDIRSNKRKMETR